MRYSLWLGYLVKGCETELCVIFSYTWLGFYQVARPVCLVSLRHCRVAELLADFCKLFVLFLELLDVRCGQCLLASDLEEFGVASLLVARDKVAVRAHMLRTSLSDRLFSFCDLEGLDGDRGGDDRRGFVEG